MTELENHRRRIRKHHLKDEFVCIHDLTSAQPLSASQRAAIRNQATGMVERIRNDGRPGLMEVFLAEYGLSTDCLLYTSPSPRDS